MGKGIEGGGGHGDDGDDKVKRFPNKAARLGDPAGFRRQKPQGQPSIEETPVQDPVFREVWYKETAITIAREFTRLARHPKFNVRKDEIKAKKELLKKETGDGTGVLKAYLREGVKEDKTKERSGIILYLAAAELYLEMTTPTEPDKNGLSDEARDY